MILLSFYIKRPPFIYIDYESFLMAAVDKFNCTYGVNVNTGLTLFSQISLLMFRCMASYILFHNLLLSWVKGFWALKQQKQFLLPSLIQV